jgi:hypothetical protein
MKRRFGSRLALVAIALGCALSPACLCNGNGHVTQAPFVAQPGDDVVNCACNLTFSYDKCSGGTCLAHFFFPVCLPPTLQRDGDGGAAPPFNPDAGEDPYSRAVDDHCRQQITPAIYHLIKVFNGGWCDYKMPFAPAGGVGSSVECFAQERDTGKGNATAYDDNTCRTPCSEIDCDYHLNCGGDVQDSNGDIHPERCKCNRVTMYGCPGDPPGDLPTALFCRPPENSLH